MRELVTRTSLGLALFISLTVVLSRPAVAGDEVEPHIRALRRGDWEEREKATKALAALGPAARDAVTKLLGDADPEVRLRARLILFLPDARVERLIIGMASPERADTSAQARKDALAATQEPSPAILRVARRFASSASPDDRRRLRVALDLLAEVAEAREAQDAMLLLEKDVGPESAFDLGNVAARKPEAAKPILRQLFKHASPAVRERAVRTFAEVAQAQDLAALEGLLQDPVPAVRRAVVEAVELMPVASAQLAKVGALAGDEDDTVAESALRLCGAFKLRLAIDPARRLLVDAAKPSSLRARAAVTLGELGDADAGEALASLVDHSDDQVQRCAIWALGACGAPAALPALERLLPARSIDPAVWYGIARAGGLKRILELAKVEPKALQALGSCPNEEAAGKLSKAAQESLARLAARENRTLHGTAVRAAFRALRDRGDAAAAAALADVFAPNDTERPAQLIRDEFLGGQGAEAARDLGAKQLVPELERLVRAQHRGGPSYRENAADALSIIDPESAKRVIGDVLRREHPSPNSFQWLSRALARAGERSFAEQSLEMSRGRLPTSRGGLLDVNHWHSAMNEVGIDELYTLKLEEAQLTFRRMTWVMPDENLGAYNYACALALGGRAEDALRWVRRAIGSNFRNWRHIACDHDLEVLFKDDRFKRLIARLRIEQERDPQGFNE